MKKWLLSILFGFSAISTVQAQTKVMAFSGSTRENSLNKKLVKEALAIAQQMDTEVTFIDLKEFPLPLYDEDLEEAEGMPANAVKLKQIMQESHIILIASPNYNGSYSGVFKNTMDWISRTEQKTYDKKILTGKKIGLMSASPGKSGGAKALDPVRALLETLRADVAVRQVSIPEADRAFNEEGRLKEEKWRIELEQLVKELIEAQAGEA